MYGNFWRRNNVDNQNVSHEFSYIKSLRMQRIRRMGYVLLLLSLQLFLLIMFVEFSEYYPDADASDLHTSSHPVFGGFDPHLNTYRKYNSMFQDMQVMIFLGFGYLMAFLKKYGYSSVGFNFFLAAILVQWAILCRGFFHLKNLKIPISIESLVDADVAVASVLISMGVLLGQTTLIQLIIMGVIEIAVYQCNSYVGDEILKVADTGASIFVHTFGAYFGLAASLAFSRFKRKNEIESDSHLESSTYTSDLFAMIGTILLWVYWPSFNSAELSGDDQHRAIINTYLSLAASCATAFVFSAILTPDSKFDMVHVQNSTLAGGVAIGASVNMMIQPYGAIFVGMLGAVLSVVGYNFVTPWIDRNLHIHDTCGVHNLHGMPGILAAVISAILAAVATETQYHTGLYDIFPARAPTNSSFNQDVYKHFQGDGRTAMQQAGYQILALIITMTVAIVSGFVTGIIMCSLCVSLQNISPSAEYNDTVFWKLEETEDPSERQPINERSRAFPSSNEVFPMNSIA